MRNVIKLGLLGVIFAMFFVNIPISAANLSDSLDITQIYEDPNSDLHQVNFILNLNPDPIDLVTTDFTTDGQCLLAHNLREFTTGGAAVTENNNLVFTIKAVDDELYEGDHKCKVSFTSHSTLDPEYYQESKLEFEVVVKDNDIKKDYNYSVKKTSSGQLREGDNQNETYSLSISQIPIYDIEISASTSGQCDLIDSKGQKTQFISQTIKAGQKNSLTFKLTAVEDKEFEGTHQCLVQHSASTLDPDFSGVAVPAYITDILDNEVNPDKPDEREYEGGLIYFSDANNDGIEDAKQPQVASFINASNGSRQAILLLESDSDNLKSGCSITDGPGSSVYDSTSSRIIESTYGEIFFSVECDNNDEPYRVMWLLDSYIDNFAGWVIYDQTNGQLDIPIDFKSEVYNLGSAVTSSVIFLNNQTSEYRFIQTESSEAIDLTNTDYYAGLASSSTVTSSRLVTFLAISFVGGGVLIKVVYDRYFKKVSADETIYPDIDHY